MSKGQVTPSELKVILHSKRANIYYLEKCRVMQKDGRILYLTETKQENLYWNIPIANTTAILLGTGTSITQAAVRLLTAAGVMLGFCGGGGTPLFSGTEVEWLSPQSEYRPTEYLQSWVGFWFDEEKRLAVAKDMQLARCKFLSQVWQKDTDLAEAGFFADDEQVERAIKVFGGKINKAKKVTELLGAEANFAKTLYAYAAQKTDFGNFARNPEANDDANKFLNHGNYLAYGLAATALWVLGIPHGFAVMHGKTRRGALVFDVADLVKDAIILPLAFVGAAQGISQQEFRQMCLQKFTEHAPLQFMFDTIKRECNRQRKGDGLDNDGGLYQPK